ncbi:uncharacterized protein G2W53_039022 [Senna tora]|uniref:Uncharacterized protein n=1 Tax=Senna tora TaxID=362788 RepID=A0A834SPB1_9FABA|nr:uncharacterized protein G2W53_039022 [Senna tora]
MVRLFIAFAGWRSWARGTPTSSLSPEFMTCTTMVVLRLRGIDDG